MDNIDREFEIDWANWLCEMHNVLRLTTKRLDPADLKPMFREMWLAGRIRGNQSAQRMLDEVLA